MPPTRLRVVLWSAMSGLLLTFAWPSIGGFTPLVFVAWLPVLHAERLHEQRTAERRRAFYPYTLVAFFLWNALCTYWFYLVSEPIATKVLSVGFPVIGNTLLMGIPWWLRRAVKHRLGDRWADAALVFFWIAGERLHHAWDLQWPWLSLGNAFGTRPSWVQWYEITGMLGGSLWVLLVNMLLNRVISTWSVDLKRARRLASVTVLVLLLPLCASLWRYGSYPMTKKGGGVEVVVVQPNVDPYTEKFSGDGVKQLERMLALAETAITDQTRVVVFPETALQEGVGRSVIRLRAFQEAHPEAALLLGMSSERWFHGSDSLPAAARPIRNTPYWYESYNAALWMPVQGDIESYHKSKLVAGVELMPFESVLGALGDFSIDMGGTTGSLGQQEERSVLRDGSSGLAIIPAICYESVFSEHIAAHVRNGGELIAVMTNDGWWSDSPGYKQHLAFSSLRAIETRRDVVRSANTGISCIVDQRGDIHQRTEWWVPAAFAARVYPNTGLTFYALYGDLLGRAAVIVAGLLIAAVLLARFRKRGQ
ncbi:MAG: apolipoprotein N-acyltransferase [Flavobacteriales bacterium]|nr:apolipoprotein N-acyltransferase [Flavobacteriales bacterium]